ncbi:MAG: hypothetical protein JKX73_03645, partial [Flavobacteriales bacterium]|nr:hypothetical protein [Flavobacteriales bacterium]
MNFSFINNCPNTYSFEWKDDGVQFSTAYNPTHVFTTAGWHTITMIAYNGNYYDSTSISVIVNNVPVADAGPDGYLCALGTYTMQASGGGSYLWTPSTGLNYVNDPNAVANPAATTTYYLTVNTSGCISTDSVTLFRDTSAVLDSMSIFSMDIDGITGVYDVHFVNPEHGYAVLWSSIWETLDGGDTWNFKHTAPGNPGQYKRFFFVNDTVAYATGAYRVFKTTDGWNTSTTLNNNIYGDLNDLFFVNDTVGYVVGYEQTIQKTSDGGLSWTLQRWINGSSGGFTSVYCTDENTCYTASNTNIVLVLKTIDGGLNWDTLYLPNPGGAVSDIYFTNDSTGYFASGGNLGLGICKTTDGGATFTAIGSIQANQIHFTDELNGYAMSPIEGRLYKTSDGGTCWYATNIGNGGHMTSMHFPETDIGYMVGWSADNFKTTFGTITAGGPTSFCAGDSVILTANLSDEYLWSTGDTTQTITVLTPGVYNALITRNGVSVLSADITVQHYSTPLLTLPDSITICVGEQVTLNPLGLAFSYSWSPSTGLSDPNIASPMASPSVSTYYSVSGTDTVTGCIATDNIYVNVVGG